MLMNAFEQQFFELEVHTRTAQGTPATRAKTHFERQIHFAASTRFNLHVSIRECRAGNEGMRQCPCACSLQLALACRKWRHDFEKLESHHGYIQWLFPIHEVSHCLVSARSRKQAKISHSLCVGVHLHALWCVFCCVERDGIRIADSAGA